MNWETIGRRNPKWVRSCSGVVDGAGPIVSQARRGPGIAAIRERPSDDSSGRAPSALVGSVDGGFGRLVAASHVKLPLEPCVQTAASYPTRFLNPVRTAPRSVMTRGAALGDRRCPGCPRT